MKYIIDLFISMKSGMLVTLYIFSITLFFSFILGILVAILRLSKINIVKMVVSLYIFIMRGTPLLLQIIFVFFGLPIIGVTFDRYTAVFIAFILNYAAYFAEIFRAGIQSIDKGQFEAAKVLGLSRFDTYRYVIFPQMFKNILPALANEVITLVKDTALVYVVGISDVLREGKIAVNRDATLLPFLVVAVFYAGYIYILTILFKKIEGKFEYYR
ncbi:amino acid ABC transporter permease [Caloramator sp. mosi_1]|uniref:amino acid ABC transporter permease n=1 Tax=Caloramator sp. mosi_1 TaxID=3023090 RepID=UPI002362440D|nr:amino acid ABC transporter permease [Caloramator sp. mosi_1]WDC85408.1 amino acid ABC transporter permease [Caloramator sp. mosi_1]